MKQFGLIGFPLGHSFSQKFFSDKFEKLGLENYAYELFEMSSLDEFPSLWSINENLKGLNVTVPHKEAVIKYLDKLDASAMKVGAVNVIQKKGDLLIGYNTDYIAFRNSLKRWLGPLNGKALILGTGGAAKAVQAALADLDIPYAQVSRTANQGDYTYSQLESSPELMEHFRLFINTTPLGMHPNVATCPSLPYHRVMSDSYFYDLVYNPAETSFMKRGIDMGAKAKNGLEMLELQAEKSWEIWTS